MADKQIRSDPRLRTKAATLNVAQGPRRSDPRGGPKADIISVLKPFQKRGVRKIREFKGRTLLADEQGLGKTIQALFVIAKYKHLRPCAIVTPASLKYNWQAEALLHFNMRLDVLEGTKASRRAIDPNGIYVLNYEIAHSWKQVFRDRGVKMLVADEVHYIKNSDAKRTKAVTFIAKTCTSVLALSGTPMTNRPIELWSILKVVCPSLFPDKGKFAWRYCKPTFTPWGWQYNGSTNAAELSRVLKDTCMVRRKKSQVLKELPAKQRTAVLYKLTPSQQREYDRAQHDFLAWLEQEDVVAAKRAKKAAALTKIGYLLRLVSDFKMQWSLQWAEDFLEDSGGKLVVLSSRTPTIDAFRKKFSDISVFVDGRVTGKERALAVRKFQNDARKRLFIGNTKAAGVGITLHAASALAYADLPFSPGDLAQGEDRVHRIGQKHPVTIFYLIALQTIEEKLSRLIQKKAEVLGNVLDGGKDPEDIDIYKDILRAITHNNK